MKSLSKTLPAFIIVALSSTLFMQQAVARDMLTLQLTAASDYVFRGISQTQNKGAMQAGFDYRHSAGPYFGLWTSYVDIPLPGGDAHAEFDLYGGFAGEIKAARLGWDLGYILYRYDESEIRFEETYFSMSFDVMPKRISATVMGSYQMDGDYQILEGVLNVSLDKGFWVKAQPGAVEDKTSVNEDYRYLKLAIGKRFDFKNSVFKGLDLAAAYSDTDIPGDSELSHDIYWLSVTTFF